MTPVEIEEKEFGIKLKKIMAEKGYSANLLASRIGINRTSFTKYFNGEASPRVGTLLAICKELKISLDYFLDEYSIDNKQNPYKEGREIISDIFYLMDKHFLQVSKNGNILMYSFLPLRPSIENAINEYLRYKDSKIIDFFEVKEKLIDTYSSEYIVDFKLGRALC